MTRRACDALPGPRRGCSAGSPATSTGPAAGSTTVLALDDDELIAAVGGRQQIALRSELDAPRPSTAVRSRSRAAGLETICRCDPGVPAGASGAAGAAGGAPRRRRPRAAARTLGAATRSRSSARGGRRRTGSTWPARSGAAWPSAGLTVVSGMALGIDSAAHAGALEAGRPTVAVLPGSADRPYPPGKRGAAPADRRRRGGRVRARPGTRACGAGCSRPATGSSRRWRR